jgi:hypothetical protein
MTQRAQDIISTFDRLPTAEQKEITKIILRRHLEIETPSVSDDELVASAEELFLELDRLEAIDAKS